MNASVGAPEVVYSTDRQDDLVRYQAIIADRLERDLASVYESPVPRAERIYLLLGRQGGLDVVEVIRLGAPDSTRPWRQTFDGLQSVGPLTYVFDPTTQALLDVRGPVAGEY
mgnify:CR=1 FL=1